MHGGLVERCVIKANLCEKTPSYFWYGGGGVFVVGGILRSCEISGNTSVTRGGGVQVYSEASLPEHDGVVENCTIVSNRVTASRQYGGGVCQSGGLVRNCIVYGNRADSRIGDNFYRDGGRTEYSCMTPAVSGTGNIASAPGFVNAAQGDYRLAPASACRNAGENQGWMEGESDLAGASRLLGSAVDMGAYESDPSAATLLCGFSAPATEAHGSLEAVFTAEVHGSETGALHYAWDFEDDGTNDVLSVGCASVTNTYGLGVYSVRLTVSNASSEIATHVREDYIRVSPSTIYVATNGTGGPATNWATDPTSW
jgi:hypothetical protein